MRYAVARLEISERDEVYRIYVTDALLAILGSGAEDARYAYLVNHLKERQEEQEVDAEAIILSIRSKLL